MCAAAPEHRRSRRYPLSANVQVRHEPSGRDFPARSVDISEGGLLMYVSPAAPVKAGQPIRVKIGAIARPQFASLGDREIKATVARVDRDKLLSIGQVAVGIAFDEKPEGL